MSQKRRYKKNNEDLVEDIEKKYRRVKPKLFGTLMGVDLSSPLMSFKDKFKDSKHDRTSSRNLSKEMRPQ